jgi:hypothetical protein
MKGSDWLETKRGGVCVRSIDGDAKSILRKRYNDSRYRTSIDWQLPSIVHHLASISVGCTRVVKDMLLLMHYRVGITANNKTT